MAKPDLVGALRDLIGSIVERHSMELVEVTFTGIAKGRALVVTVDRPEGAVPLDELTKVSEEISRALDLEDMIEGRYTLEVASAGIERPLVKPSDYQRFAGREVKVRCVDPIEGRRNFKGTITGSNDETFVLKLEEGDVVEIPYTAVARTKLVVNWEEELKGGKR